MAVPYIQRQKKSTKRGWCDLGTSYTKIFIPFNMASVPCVCVKQAPNQRTIMTGTAWISITNWAVNLSLSSAVTGRERAWSSQLLKEKVKGSNYRWGLVDTFHCPNEVQDVTKSQTVLEPEMLGEQKGRWGGDGFGWLLLVKGTCT